MKHKLQFRRCVAMLMLLAVSALSWAYDFESNGIYYNKSGSNAIVTSGDVEYSGAVSIPSTVKSGGVTYAVTEIGESAFEDCTGLTSVVIGDEVTNIGDYAFWGCSNLTSITMGKKVTTIGDRVFIECSSLIKVTLNSQAMVDRKGKTSMFGTQVKEYVIGSVTSIGDDAFQNCTGLTSVFIGSTVTSIGSDAFSGCSGLTKAQFANIKSLCRMSFLYPKSNPLYYAKHLYIGNNEVTELVIPNSVTYIASSTFCNCEGLKSITIPNSVTSIEEGAFSGCSGLTSITIPNSVTSIGNSAFYGCSGLTSISIPESVTRIGEDAFCGCTGLTSVTIGSGVTRIGDDAFSGCSGLTKAEFASIESLCEITFGDNNGHRESNPLFYAKHLYINGSEVTDVVIPSGIKEIRSNTFINCEDIKSIVLPKRLEIIGSFAFSGCTGLTSIIIPRGVTSIGYYAFSGCTSLTKAEFASIENLCGGISFSDYSSNPLYYAEHLYINGQEVTDLVIPENVTTIGAFAFSGYMYPVTCLTENPPTLSSFAFEQKSKTLYVPSSLIDIYKAENVWKKFANILSLEDKEAGIRAKGSCGDNVNYVLTADSVLTISGTGAMTDYSSSSSVPWYNYRTAIKSVVMEDGVTRIGEYAFSGCSGLTSVTIPNSVTRIGRSAFSGCSGLTSITIPNSVTTIGIFAFTNCTGLVFVNIGNGVTSIGSSAFSGCTGLAEVNCAAEKVPTMENNVFSNSNQANATLYVPASVVDAYKAANYWKGFGKILGAYVDATSVALDVTEATLQVGGTLTLTATVLPVDAIQTVKWTSSNTDVATVSDKGLVRAVGSGTAVITATTTDGTELSATCEVTVSDVIASGSCGENVNFALRADYTLTISGTGAMTDYSSSSDLPWNNYRNDIKSVVVEDGVTSIGSVAFYCCSNLTSVTIGNSVTSIGDRTFSGCSGLTSVTIPESVTSIGSHAFYNCSGLTSISIPNSVTSIGEYAFRNCSSLTSVTIPNSVTSIEQSAFDGCSGLTSVTIPESVTSIGSLAFSGCLGLTSITIPNSVTSIGYGAFRNCSSLISITIPNSVTSIGEYVFDGCSGLTEIICRAKKIPSIRSNTFDNVSKEIPVYVPGIVLNAYMTALYWSDFTNFQGVYELATSISLNRDDATLKKGNTLILTAKVEPEDAFQTVRWSSSNPSIATVDANGEVSGITVGKAIVTATTTDGTELSATCEVTVSDVIASGSCGENVNFALRADYTLTISGTGAMTDYSSSSDLPWNNYRNDIKSVVVEDGVTSISSFAFYCCSNLTSVTIGNSVTSIGSHAFYICSGLTSISIPNSVTSIGVYAFYGCSSLTSITIPNSVTSIGGYAFRNCSSLTSVTIPNSVTSIGGYAFNGCSGLETITVEDGNAVYDSRNNCNAIIESVSGTLINGCKNTVIPEGVTGIGVCAFYNCIGLTSVVLPKSVTDIGEGAFYGCTGLTSVEISGSMTAVGQNLKSAASTAPVTAGGTMNGIGIYAFYGCTSLESITIPESVASIGEYAFYGCSSLTSITIPNSVTSIGSDAFESCSSLTSVNIPESVSSIGRSAFSGCTNLPVEDGLRYADTYLVGYAETKDTYSIKEGTKWIGDGAFSGCSDLKSINIPESAKSIGYNAFYNCSGLASVNIPEGVRSIGGSAFSGCTGLTSVTIPESVTIIGDYAFNGCDNLVEVTINSNNAVNSSIYGSQVKKYVLGESVTAINSYAFKDCSELVSVSMPENLAFIGIEAFSGCSALTSVSIPGGVWYIGQKSFEGCSSLTSVSIGNGVQEIGEAMFQGCNSLTTINIPESVTRVGYNAFDGCTSLPVENNLRYADTYLVETVDKTQSSYAIKNGTRFIGSDAFNGCAGLSSVAIPEGVLSIGNNAFALCENLVSVTIPKSVTAIGNSAFSGCSELPSITIPESVLSIADGAFSDCTNLKTVTCHVTSSNRSTEHLIPVPEPVLPEPGVDPSEITEVLYPFNPAHNTELDPPTTANCDETTDITIDNVYTEEEIRELWLAYYKKVYNTRTATTRARNKVNMLLSNPYIKRNSEEVVLKSVYTNEWNMYWLYLEEYEEYQAYIKYPTIPVPSTGRSAFDGVSLSDATLYVYENVMDAYKATVPWSGFGQILPIDPTDVKDVKVSDTSNDENAPIYDLGGRRLTEKPKRGFYIQGGKKYLAQ